VKLLKNERAYRRWAREWDTYNDRWNVAVPRSYPCYGYTVVRSYGYEEEAPEYLYPRDVRRMLDALLKVEPSA